MSTHEDIRVTSLWARWRLQSSAYRLFAQPFVQMEIKEDINSPCHLPFWGGSTGDRWIPLTKASNAENVFIPSGAGYSLDKTLLYVFAGPACFVFGAKNSPQPKSECTACVIAWLFWLLMTSSNGNIFRVTGPFCGEFTGDRWIPHTKASDAGLRCFLWSAPE